MKYKEVFDPFVKTLKENFSESFSEEEFEEFTQYLDDKMSKGHQEHGDVVFDKGLKDILNELSFEAADLAGWSVIALSIVERDNFGNEVKKEILEIASNGFKNWLKIKRLGMRVE